MAVYKSFKGGIVAMGEVGVEQLRVCVVDC